MSHYFRGRRFKNVPQTKLSCFRGVAASERAPLPTARCNLRVGGSRLGIRTVSSTRSCRDSWKVTLSLAFPNRWFTFFSLLLGLDSARCSKFELLKKNDEILSRKMPRFDDASASCHPRFGPRYERKVVLSKESMWTSAWRLLKHLLLKVLVGQSHGFPWKLPWEVPWEFPWCTVGFITWAVPCRIPLRFFVSSWSPPCFPWDPPCFLWDPMASHRIFAGIPRDPVGTHDIPWAPVGFRYTPWDPSGSSGKPTENGPRETQQ